MNFKTIVAFLLSALLLLAAATPALAQSELVLDLSRDFGYAGFNSDIEGLFSMHASGPDDLQRVLFYIDDVVIAEDTAAPFSIQFTTKDHAPGTHTLHAVGFTAGGRVLASNQFVRVFLSAEDAGSQTLGLVVPLLIILGVLSVAGIFVPMLLGRKLPTLGKYGLSGGAVCPKCALPFPLHFFSFHALGSRFERCPHCGRWVWARKANRAELAAAEDRWRGDLAEDAAHSQDAASRRQKQIDDSRFDN
jgi:hypothetical protein